MEHLHVDPGAFDRLTRLVRSLQPNSNSVSLFRDAEAASELVVGAYVEAIATAEPSTANAIRRRAAHRYEVMRRADSTMRNLVGRPF